MVTIRLVDLAADKWPDWLARAELSNAGSTLHGSQLFSYRPVGEVVHAQLTALKQIGSKSRLRLIWPSGGSLEDFLRLARKCRILVAVQGTAWGNGGRLPSNSWPWTNGRVRRTSHR